MKQLTFLCLLILSLSASSQDALQSANTKFNNSDWVSAMADYMMYLKKNDKDSAAWFSLGICQFNTKNFETAIKSFQKAGERKYNSSLVALQIAKSHASLSNVEQMYRILEEAAENGLFTYARLTLDAEFEAFQRDQRFLDILNKVAINAYPCLSDENARHFDFWIGEWDVYANGRKVGVNYITRAQGGCAIHENYVTQGNYAGQSINFYSPVDEKWHQHWVGSSGDVYNYVESARAPGMLQFISDFKAPGTGALSLSRLTFTLNDDGTVRQLFESSTDNGQSWTPAFDGLYKKRN